MALMSNGDDHLFLGNHVLRQNLVRGFSYLSAPLVTVLFLDLFKLITDDLKNQFFVSEDLLKPGYLTHQFLVLPNNLVTVETGEPLETHIKDCLGLDL